MKVVVTHVPAGAGHTKASEAVAAALRELEPSDAIHLLDAQEGMDAWYQWTYSDGYLNMTNRFPKLWGAAYNGTDTPALWWLSKGLHRFNNGWHGKKLENLLLSIDPDVIVGTHFFPMEVAGTLKAHGKLKAKLITVITDYMPHAVWTAPAIDCYAVGSQETQLNLIERGVPDEQIEVTGIPIDPKFSLHLDKEQLQQKLGLDPKLKTVLSVSGGWGTGPVMELIEQLDQLKMPIQILVVCGKNRSLESDLNARKLKMKHTVKVYGFVDNIHELMEISDVMVTKPGGLSSAEGLAKGIPLLMIVPVPGQEARNAKILRAAGAALVANSVKEVPQMLTHLLESPETLTELKRHCKSFGSIDAAWKIAKLVHA